jgi:hypothetical protein
MEYTHHGCQLPTCLKFTTAILGRLADVCGVFLNSVSYFRKVGGCLHGMCNLLVIWGRLPVICGRCVICQVLQTGVRMSVGCVYSVTYMMQIGSFLQCISELCHLPKVVFNGLWTWDRLVVGSHGVCTPSVTLGKLTVVVNGVWIWDKLAVGS